MSATPPSRDSYVTDRRRCPICDQPPDGRGRYCSPRCRQAAYRRRHQPPAVPPLPTFRPRRDGTVYECSDCETRYLGEQWCSDCNRPCRRVATGGTCPSCEEVITVDELLDASVTDSIASGPENQPQ